MEYDVEDAVFYALRLREAGMLKSSLKNIIFQAMAKEDP
jgi:hypothetical protein